jgi:hypothetical protein
MHRLHISILFTFVILQLQGLVYFFNAAITIYWVISGQQNAKKGIEGILIFFYCFNSVVLRNPLLNYNLIHRNILCVFKRSTGAAEYVVFPIYVPILVCSAIADMLVGFQGFFIHYKPFEENSWTVCFIYAACCAIQHFVIEGYEISIRKTCAATSQSLIRSINIFVFNANYFACGLFHFVWFTF